MENIVSSSTGLIHTVFALIAMLTGAIIIFNRKGTTFHRRIGYVYVVSMLILNITAFGIYRLFNGFGLFHVLAIISLLTLIAGLYPVRNRKKVENWYLDHLETMSWSVVGLYAAFAAEITVRFVPKRHFFWAVGLSVAVIIIGGAILINKRKKLESNKLKST